MWKGNARAALQRAARYQSRHHQQQYQKNAQIRRFWPYAGAAAAISVGVLVAELDQQQQQEAKTRIKQQQQHDSINEDYSTTTTTPSSHQLLWPRTITTTTTTRTLCETAGGRPGADLRRFRTLKKMDENSSKESLESKYDVNWEQPLGSGSFGAVYLAKDRVSGEKVAVKKISKKYTNDDEFYREMNALLHLRKAGGHPGICSLREHFNEKGHFFLILDLVAGGEMFDHLVEQGAYSEADAARLIREIASSLYFIHGLSLTHGDLKPENLMLSSKNPSDAVIKLVDFGCADIKEEAPESNNNNNNNNNNNGISSSSSGGGGVVTSFAGKTLAYCPPEVLKDGNNKGFAMSPSMDMWALGTILYIMLTGLHPYDIRGNASDEEVAKAIMSGEPPPLRNSPITAHLSDSSVNLIERLMDQNPKTRMDAWALLQHPWTKGETALTDKMALAGKKLSMYHAYKTGIGRTVFEKLVTGSDNLDDSSKRTSLLEQSFRWFDPENKGHIDLYDLQSVKKGVSLSGYTEKDAAPLSLSNFSSLLAENMRDRYFPKGHVVYREGEVGNRMFFISSGTVTVSTKTGFTVQRGPGDFFGEGALLSPKKRRSATIHCNTPVHAMEVSREYFDQYLAKSDSALYLFLREKDIIRKKNRAKMVLRLQKNLEEREFQFGETLFATGDHSKSMFLVEEGKIDLLVDDKLVFKANPGNVCGENSALTNRIRSATAICATESGCVAYEMQGKDLKKLIKKAPDIRSSLENLCLRRDFKKAVVMRLNKEFPYDNPREAWDAVKTDKSQPDRLSKQEILSLMKEFYGTYSNRELTELIATMDLTNSGSVSYDEFKKVFIADVKQQESK